jgi:uncharacterized membrane protein (DUF485 family)
MEPAKTGTSLEKEYHSTMSLLLVVLVVVLILWFLALLAAPRYPAVATNLGWLPFLAVLVLTLLVHAVHL